MRIGLTPEISAKSKTKVRNILISIRENGKMSFTDGVPVQCFAGIEAETAVGGQSAGAAGGSGEG